MSFRAPMDLRSGSPVNMQQSSPGAGGGQGTPPTSLRLVQPHPAFATRLRSRSDAQGQAGQGASASPTYTRYPHRPLLLGSGGGGEGAHAHNPSDVENQMPPAFGRATRGGGRDHSPARGKGREWGYGYGYGAGGGNGRAEASSGHTQQHSFSHPATNAGSSRNGNIQRGNAPGWSGYDLDRGAESSTPRAAGGMEDALRDTGWPGVSLGEPLARYDTASSMARSDNEGDSPHGMPPISLGVLRHRRQASSMDISDVGPADGADEQRTAAIGGSTPAVMMHAAVTAAAGNGRAILQELANSKDEGDTLDLSRKGIERITEGDARLLRYGVGKEGKGVWRLALSYNRLQHFSFDQSMSMLGRLRYLNLKGNNLSELPPVLTAMPSLEILDVSKNAIINLPDDPGRLVQLRVLSLTRNKLNRLPSYLAYFANLRVLKVEDNPIEWPPREILEMRHVPLASDDDPSPALKPKEDDMRVWIATVKDWMRNQEQEQIRLQAEGMQGSATSPPSPSGSLASFNAATSAPETEMPMTPADDVGSDSWKIPDQGASSPSLQLKELSITPTQPWLRNRRRANSNSPTVMPLLSPVMARSTSNGPIPAVVRQAPSPLAQTPPAFPPIQAQLERENSSGSTRTIRDADAPSHARGSSYTGDHRMSVNLSAKKSLPDLRQGLAPFGQIQTPLSPTAPSPARVLPPNRGLSSKPSMPMLRVGEADATHKLGRKTSDDLLKQTAIAQSKAAERQGAVADLANERHPLAMDSRNSYFRRLSTLPASSISKAVPTSLLQFVDATRGILFAISQSYTALRQYLASSSQERVAGVFMRVMDPASAYMDSLINALDRFDSMTRRRLPPASAIRQVLECCRDNVQVFAKVVAVLELQVTVLADAGDVRYTKTLLLLLYGSLAEIAASWQAMTPLRQDISDLLNMEALPPPSGSSAAHRAGSSISSIGRTPISPIMERTETSPGKPSPATVTQLSPQVTGSPSRRVITAETTPTRPVAMAREKSRRNAGSFSSEDVQMGMMLGPNDAQLSLAGEDSGGSTDSGLMIPPPRSGRREVKLPLDGVVIEEDEDKASDDLVRPSPVWTHLRRSASDDITMNTPTTDDGPLEPPRPPFAQRHGQSSSTGRLANLNGTASDRQMGAVYGDASTPVPPTPGSAATLVDEGVLDTLEQASDLAYTVWLRLTEDLHALPQDGVSKRVEDLLSSLGVAEELTRKLRESLMEVRAYDSEQASQHMTPAGSSGSSARSLIPAQARLANDAQSFIRIVVRVSEQIIALQTNREHVFPLAIKTLLAKLTSKTRECGILMQVSTLKPTSSTAPTESRGSSSASSTAGSRPFSPAFGYKHHQPGASTDLAIAAHPASAGLQTSTSGPGYSRQQQMLSRSRSAGVVPVPLDRDAM